MCIKRKSLGSLFMLGNLLFSMPTSAFIVDRLYEADLMTKSKEDLERSAVLTEGLEQVLMRVSGRPNVIDHPSVQAALKTPQKYTQQYAYQGDLLEATFNPGMVQKLLNDAQFPIWSQNRPELVLWLAMDTEDDRRLVGIETDPSIVALVQKSATLRGLPIIVPLMDIEDMSKVTVTDVLGKFPSSLEQASERYGYDGLLVGRITAKNTVESGQWQTHWQLMIDGKNFSWSSDNVGLNKAIQAGMDGVAEKLASLYAITPSSDSHKAFLLEVEDVFSVSDYAKAMHYLKSLSHVQDVLVDKVDAQKTVFKIIPKSGGSLATITSSMDLDDSMVALASAESNHVEASYRWISGGS